MERTAPGTSAEDVLARAQARTARVRVVLDGDLLDEHAVLEAELATLDPDSAEAAALAESIVALEDRVATAEVEFVFKGMGRGRWRKLAADHPPTDEQKVRGADFDVDVFPFLAMAESIVEPALTAEDLTALNDDVWDEATYQQVWGACLRANVAGALTRPESAAARSVLQNVRLRSVQPSDSESREAS